MSTPPHALTMRVLPLELAVCRLDADGPLRSGPPVGARNDRDGFCPKWVTGPCAGKRLCPV